jgi:glutamine cyclotransferase
VKIAYAKLLAIPLLILSLSLSASTPAAEGKALLPVYGYKIVHTYPHDTKAFTEGLLYRDGFLYESTGLKGHSTIRKVDLKTGHVPATCCNRRNCRRNISAKG